MIGLVEQLQLDTASDDVSVTTLLRKVKIAAVKLQLTDALQWVESELGGYKTTVPEYRQCQGQTVAFNPYHGWQPIQFGNWKTADLLASVQLSEPIGNYEELLSGSGPYMLPLPNSIIAELNKNMSYEVPKIANQISRGGIIRVIQHVQDMVLEWALELSRVGIIGKGLAFSEKEKVMARESHILITNLHGNVNTGDLVGDNATLNQYSSNLSWVEQKDKCLADINEAIISANLDNLQKSSLISASREIDNADNQTSFGRAYDKFIQVAANHMTVIAPFLPALASLYASFPEGV